MSLTFLHAEFSFGEEGNDRDKEHQSSCEPGDEGVVHMGSIEDRACLIYSDERSGLVNCIGTSQNYV